VVDLAVEPRIVYLAAEPILRSSYIREPSVNSGRLLVDGDTCLNFARVRECQRQ